MSARNLLSILALLDHDEQGIWSVLDRAVELAQAERARLTLAKTTDPGTLVKWFAPLAVLSRAAPVTEPDMQAFAFGQLARAAEFVPADVCVETVLLGADTIASLRRLTSARAYDIVVCADRLLGRSRALRRELARLGLSTLAVAADADAEANLVAVEAGAASGVAVDV